MVGIIDMMDDGKGMERQRAEKTTEKDVQGMGRVMTRIQRRSEYKV